MTTFNNNASQKERRAVIKNDATTLHEFAQSQADEVGGRWAKPQTVNASEQAVHYPKLPTSSPWSNPIEAVEPPLGIDVNEPVVTGEPHELEASLQADLGLEFMLRNPDRVRPNTPASPVCAGVDDATAVSPSSPSGLPRPVDRDLGKGPHVASGAGHQTVAIERPAPTNPLKIKRRLV